MLMMLNTSSNHVYSGSHLAFVELYIVFKGRLTPKPCTIIYVHSFRFTMHIICDIGPTDI